MIVLLGHLHLKPAQLDDFLQSMQAIGAKTRAEPGCLFYSLAPADRAEGTVLMAQRWRDQTSLDAHIAGPQAEAFRKRWSALVRVEVERFEVSDH